MLGTLTKEDLDQYYDAYIENSMISKEQVVWFQETFGTLKEGEQKPWKKFKNAFMDKFSPSKVICQGYQDLMNLMIIKLLPEVEDLFVYADRFRKTYAEAKKYIGNDAGEVMAHLFVNSLPAYLKNAIIKDLLSGNGAVEKSRG